MYTLPYNTINQVAKIKELLSYHLSALISVNNQFALTFGTTA